jgi:hypothetical protein
MWLFGVHFRGNQTSIDFSGPPTSCFFDRSGFRPGEPPCVCAPIPNQVQQLHYSHQSTRPILRAFGSIFRGKPTSIDCSVDHRLLKNSPLNKTRSLQIGCSQACPISFQFSETVAIFKMQALPSLRACPSFCACLRETGLLEVSL